MDTGQNGNIFTVASNVTIYKSQDDWMLYNWLNAEHVEIFYQSHFMHQLLEAGKKEFIADESFPEDDLKYLIEEGFLVTDDKRGAEEIEERYSEIISSDKLILILLPADQACNFNCLYCYEDHAEKVKMGSSHKEALVSFVKGQALRELHVEYFGGEPTVNLKFILELNSELIKLSEKEGFRFTSSITTNGYLLTEEIFLNLIHHNLTRFQITVDGLPEDHDLLRPLAGGKGTFDKIMNNLRTMKALGDIPFIIDLRVNFNDESATPEKRKKFLSLLKKEFGGDARFRLRFRPVSDYSSLNNRANSGDSYCVNGNGTKLQKIYELEAQAAGFILADIPLFLSTGSSSCYASKPNSLVISPDLKVRKCTVALDDPINEVGFISKEGRFIKNQNWEKWILKSGTPKNEKCGGCGFFNQCLGSACPLVNIKQNESVCPDVKNDLSHPVKLIINHKKLLGDE